MVNGLVAGAIVHGLRQAELTIEVHPSAGPLEVALSVLAGGNDGALPPGLPPGRLGSFVSGPAHVATSFDAHGVATGVLFLEDIIEELIGEIEDATTV